MDRRLLNKERELDDKTRMYDRLAVDFEELQKNLGMKEQYL